MAEFFYILLKVLLCTCMFKVEWQEVRSEQRLIHFLTQQVCLQGKTNNIT